MIKTIVICLLFALIQVSTFCQDIMNDVILRLRDKIEVVSGENKEGHKILLFNGVESYVSEDNKCNTFFMRSFLNKTKNEILHQIYISYGYSSSFNAHYSEAYDSSNSTALKTSIIDMESSSTYCSEQIVIYIKNIYLKERISNGLCIKLVPESSVFPCIYLNIPSHIIKKHLLKISNY